jgi:type I restriction enzyme, R subunit
MSYEYSEDGLVEAATQEVLEQLGWRVVTAWTRESFGETGLLGRANKGEVILKRHLRAALMKLNPNLPQAAYLDAINQITAKTADKSLYTLNLEKHSLLTNGVKVNFRNNLGVMESKTLKVFDFKTPLNNEFLAVRQLEVVGAMYNRRPDVVAFVNGIPLVLFELKAHHTELSHAFHDNLRDYKDTIPELFHCNAFIVLSNGTDAKVGTLTSPYKYFLDWKRIIEDEEGMVELDTMLKGTCDPARLLDLFENFLLFDSEAGKISKIMAKNHQYIGVNKVIEQSKNIEDLKGKLGVFWHTQGSGKSYSIVFLCQKLLRKFGKAFTFLIVVDRSELERQLYDTFTSVGAVTEKGVIAENRHHLRELLAQNHRYVFTLIHKFSIDPKLEQHYPLITDRDNIIVISDEAHRTQGGKFAQNMRFYGLPHASYLGFTGTPIFKEDEELTKNIFGDYVSVYDFKRAIEDKATLPLRYLNRGEKLAIENPQLDEKMAEILENENLDDDQRKKLEREFARDYPILTANTRLDPIAKDLVWHFNERGYQGKAMLVALDKPTAVKMYNFIEKHWADYCIDLQNRILECSDEQEALKLSRQLTRVKETEVCVVVSAEQNEIAKFQDYGLDITPHRKKMTERDLEKEFKDPQNPFRLAIVCAMWITGFDAPCVSTVYLDKPIKGHTLMQTIARANRVYDDEKENGLIVDYGNVYQKLKDAYAIYGEGDKKTEQGQAQENPLEQLADLAAELELSISGVSIFLTSVSFDFQTLVDAKSPMEKLSIIRVAMNAICQNEKTRASFEFMARDVFRKYKALFPEEQVKPYLKAHNAIEAIYEQLNQRVKSADITSIILRLQQEVDVSLFINGEAIKNNDYIDLSTLDFEALSQAFNKSDNKNTHLFDIQEAIERKIEQMMQQNPLRYEFYERYKAIIESYNEGKDASAVQQAFEDIKVLMQDLSIEEKRAIAEGLDQDTLAIFDLLKKPQLSKKEEAEVKNVAVQTLAALKAEKLKIENWRESTQVSSQVRSLIFDNLQHLPQNLYEDEEVNFKTDIIYQHVYSFVRTIHSTL